jgi:hypothetical protein
MKRRTKTAAGVLDYQEDWSDWLGTDTISSSSWVVATGLTADSDTNTTTTATLWASSGTLGTSYVCTNTVITAAGRTEARSFLLDIISK